MVKTAEETNKKRLSLLLQTVCGTGIRVSELDYITAEAAFAGEATVSSKGKTRTVFLVKDLQTKLLKYCAAAGITSGPIFISRCGNPLSRTNVWREMKALCKQAHVDSDKA